MGMLLVLQTAPWPSGGYGVARGLVGLAVVLALIALAGWLLRRGAFGPAAAGKRAGMTVDAAVPLGERRSLMVVTIESRRLLLGVTPAQVTLITELQPKPPAEPFDRTLAQRVTPPYHGGS